MSLTLKPFFITLILFSNISLIFTEQTFWCRQNKETCTLSGIRLSANSIDFEINSEKKDDIESVHVLNSSIPTLTNVFCDTFPNLLQLSIAGQNILEIQKDALDFCTEMTGLSLYGNNIRTLPVELFSRTRNLESIILGRNQITSLDVNLLVNLPLLHALDLQYNNLGSFSPEILRNNNNLAYLLLNGNRLKQLDGRKLIGYVSDVDSIFLEDNDFTCEIKENLKQVLGDKGKFEKCS